MSGDISLTFNLGNFLACSFLALLSILATKFVWAVAAFVFLPKQEGVNSWAAAGLLIKMFGRFPLSFGFAIGIGLVVALSGGGLGAALIAGIVIGVLGTYF